MEIYDDVIDYLDRGKVGKPVLEEFPKDFSILILGFFIQMWEKAIEFSKELANQHESQTFDYKSLSLILVKT